MRRSLRRRTIRSLGCSVPGPNWVDVLANRARALPVVDPHDRELTISCGAAVGIFEVAARRFSLQATIALLPDPEYLDHFAQITVAASKPPDAGEVVLFDAIKNRRTDRSAYFMEGFPDDLAPACCAAVETAGASLRFFEDSHAIKTIAGLVAEADRLQFEDPNFRRELASWVHSTRLKSRDGMSGAGFGMPDILTPAARFVIRTFDLGNNVAAADEKKILAGSPALAAAYEQVRRRRGLAQHRPRPREDAAFIDLQRVYRFLSEPAH